MYIFEMQKEDYKEFISKYDISFLIELKNIMTDYLESEPDNKKIAEFIKITDKYILDGIEIYHRYNSNFKAILNFEELNTYFNEMSILELSDIGLMIKKIKNKSLRTELIYKLAWMVFREKGNVIMHKDIESLSLDEVRYYLNNISSNSLEMYAIDCKSNNIEPTPEEFYNYYHNRSVKMLMKTYEVDNEYEK